MNKNKIIINIYYYYYYYTDSIMIIHTEAHTN